MCAHAGDLIDGRVIAPPPRCNRVSNKLVDRRDRERQSGRPLRSGHLEASCDSSCDSCASRMAALATPTRTCGSRPLS